MRPAFFMSIFSFYYVLVCNSVVYLKEKGFCVMYIAVTGSKNNKDVYIYQSFPKRKRIFSYL